MKDLRSRVEALEQVSCSTSPCPVPAQPAPTRACLQPGFPSSPALFLTSQQQSQLCSPPPAAPTAVAFPGRQPFEQNHSSPASPPWWVLHPPGWSCWPGGALTAPLLPAEAPAGAGPLSQLHAARGCRCRPHQPPVPLPPAAGQDRLPERADLLPGGAAGDL